MSTPNGATIKVAALTCSWMSSACLRSRSGSFPFPPAGFGRLFSVGLFLCAGDYLFFFHLCCVSLVMCCEAIKVLISDLKLHAAE
uniref:Uncharacterized protein n=1 Tax=Poecilia latipinna TaxID=48699 RepID=A0A3B3TVV4_9TELE